MKWASAIAAVFLVVSTVASAQSIEQSYAEQCAADQVSETCDALREALMAKLAKKTSQQPAANAPSPAHEQPAVVTEVQVSAEQFERWGVLAALTTGGYMTDRNYSEYRWSEDGNKIYQKNIVDGGPGVGQVYSLGTDPRTILWYDNLTRLSKKDTLQVLGDGSIYFPKWKGVLRLEPDGRLILYKGKLDKKTGRVEKPRVYQVQMPVTQQTYFAELSRLRARDQASAATKSNNGLFGAVLGAAMGAAAGSAAGMDMGQTADLMVQGAALGSGNSEVAQGYAKGMAEETAKNETMAQSLRDATARGLASGAAEYARRQEYGGMQQNSGSDTYAYDQPGITIEDSIEPTISTPAPAEPETRQTYAWCMALRPNQNVTYSTVQQITIPYRGWSDSSMAHDFGAVAGGGVSVCSNTDSYAAAQGQLEGSRAGHRGIKQTTTSAILKP